MISFLLLFLINAWDINHEQSFEPGSHLFLFAKSVEADDKVEPNIEVWGITHYIFINFDGLPELLLLNISEAYILLDLHFHFLILLHGRVEGHIVHLDGLVELALFEVDVAHVHTQPTSLRILFVLEYNSVRV